ncbi:aspartate phosphatase [Bacillus thuringiensis]|uniref:response regulator aspartate phosphatase n=1 Tax=Bacillus TaxID=1386 RepID=UPI000530D52A|nr:MULTISPECIES: aspartate phosphatase [Bacillus cereus group]EMA7397456.1 aspartate phosphatase [Bacillus cereus]EMA7400909.1 aspartate phosphatase [Bacillus cereus]KGT43939.1 aspartate phosphatase [Bacillus cereus]MBG9466575.1 aspartate phosphatase [Bacillus thuringiensis]PET61079.1 aspartate phosphatase [Bacillus cereus]
MFLYKLNKGDCDTIILNNEKVTRLLNEWYKVILSKQITKATRMKEEVDEKISVLMVEQNRDLQDQNLLLYYSLLDYSYKVLINKSYVTRSDFDAVEKLTTKTIDEYLRYYYHFYKAVHNTMIANYMEAMEQFEEAERLLEYIPNDIEKAEFNYKLGELYYHLQQPLLTIKHVMKAKDIYKKHEDYVINQIECDTILGLASVTLSQFEQGEELFVKCLDMAKKHNCTRLITLIQYNLGFLYAKQGISATAIRHLMDVYKSEKPYHKTVFLLAREHFKVNEIEKAQEFLTQGFELADVEYTHHLRILRAQYDENYKQNLETTIADGLDYFESQKLYGFMEEYSGILAKKLYQEGNHEKASQYFNISYDAKELLQKGSALK